MTYAAEAKQSAPDAPILEIGHYYGLSTAGLVLATESEPGRTEIHTLDAHIPDPWVSNPAPYRAFVQKWLDHFFTDRLVPRVGCSELLEREHLAPYSLIFYDGDHGPEQLRFTREVASLPGPRWFMFAKIGLKGKYTGC